MATLLVSTASVQAESCVKEMTAIDTKPLLHGWGMGPENHRYISDAQAGNRLITWFNRSEKFWRFFAGGNTRLWARCWTLPLATKAWISLKT